MLSSNILNIAISSYSEYCYPCNPEYCYILISWALISFTLNSIRSWISLYSDTLKVVILLFWYSNRCYILIFGLLLYLDNLNIVISWILILISTIDSWHWILMLIPDSEPRYCFLIPWIIVITWNSEYCYVLVS
jgi:hypothetical protein